jgi:hypothetical protein
MSPPLASAPSQIPSLAIRSSLHEHQQALTMKMFHRHAYRHAYFDNPTQHSHHERSRTATRHCTATRHLAPQLHARRCSRISLLLTGATAIHDRFTQVDIFLAASTHGQPHAQFPFGIVTHNLHSQKSPGHCTALSSRLYANASSPLRWHTATSHGWQPARSLRLTHRFSQPHLAAVRPADHCTQLSSRLYATHPPLCV